MSEIVSRATVAAMGEYPEIRGFEFLGVLRRGGSATIYEAVDLASGRHVAVKVLEGVELTSSQQLAFSQEVRVMGNLDDEPHVVPVLHSGATTMGRPYVVMQLMVGGSLADRIERVGPLPVDDVLAVGIGVGLALEATHTRGIRHCDVKPANILFDHELRPMLSDFGVANVDAGDDSLTKRLGMTAMYAAPEVINDEVPTTASDIYSFGATLHAALMGRPPFSARSNVALLQKILAAETPPPLPDRVPAALRELIHSMMQRNPADRPIRAGDIAAGLQRIAGGANTTVDRPTSGRERSGAQSVFDSIALDAPLVPSADNWPTATTPAAVARVATVQEAAPAAASAQRSAGRSTRGRALLLLVAPLIIVGGIVGVSAVTGSPEIPTVVDPSGVQADGPRSSAGGDVQDVAEQAGREAAAPPGDEDVVDPREGRNGDEPPTDELAMVDDEANSSVFPAVSASSTPTPEPSASSGSAAGSVSFESEPSEEQSTASALIEDLPPATVTEEPPLDDEPAPAPSATPTATPQPTTTRVPSAAPSATSLPSPTPAAQTQSDSTASPSPTATTSPTANPAPTATAVPTATPTLAPTATPTPAPTATPAGVPRPTNLRSPRQGIDGSGRLFISLEWSKAGDIPKVEIERDGLIFDEDDNLSRRDTPDPSLVPGQQVAYRVRAVGVDGAFSDWSERLDVTVQMPDASEVLVPANLRVTAQGFEGASGQPFIGLAWSTPDWMSFVEIDRDGVLFTDDNRSHRDVPDPALVQGQTVTYRIRAVHHSGQKSPWSPEFVVIVNSS